MVVFVHPDKTALSLWCIEVGPIDPTRHSANRPGVPKKWWGGHGVDEHATHAVAGGPTGAGGPGIIDIL